MTALGFNQKFSEYVIKADNGPLKGSLAPMVDLGTHEFINVNTGKTIPEEWFMNSCEY